MSEQFRTPGRPRRSEVYRRLDTQIRELWERLGGLPNPVEAADIWRGIWFEEAHHSTALEGNTLVLKQVEVLLSEGRAIGAKELREYAEVKGYADAAEWVYRQANHPDPWHAGDLLSLAELRRVHHMALTPAWDVAPHPDAGPKEGPGSFREHEIHPFPGGMRPVSWVLVPAELDLWFGRVGGLDPTSASLCEDLASLHCRFEQIHPFLDGNGRTGRLVLNLLLVRLGYPPVVIYKRQRPGYLKALRRADAGDCGLLGEVLARAVLDSLNKFVVPAVAGPARLVPLKALATSDLSSNALRVAASRGRLRAIRGADGEWRSSRHWVDEYRTGRHKRLP